MEDGTTIHYSDEIAIYKSTSDLKTDKIVCVCGFKKIMLDGKSPKKVMKVDNTDVPR